MFGIGLPELGVILIIAFLVLGPEKIIDFSKALGRWAAEFKKSAGRMEAEVWSEWRKASGEGTPEKGQAAEKGTDVQKVDKKEKPRR